MKQTGHFGEYVFWGNHPGYGRPTYYVHDQLPCRLAAALEGYTQLFKHTKGNSGSARCQVCHKLLRENGSPP